MRGLLVLPLLAVAYPAFADSLLTDARQSEILGRWQEIEGRGKEYSDREPAFLQSDLTDEDRLSRFTDFNHRWGNHRELRGGFVQKFGSTLERAGQRAATMAETPADARQDTKATSGVADECEGATRAEKLAWIAAAGDKDWDFSCGTEKAETAVASIEDDAETATTGDAAWSDEFNGGSWQSAYSATEAWQSGDGRDGYGASAWSLNDPGNLATIENGELVLRSKPGCKDGKMCAVELIGKKPFTHGRVEVRAKVSNSADAFNAIWTTGVQNGDGKVWPEIGEIDFAEFAMNGGSDSGKPHFTVHTKGGDAWGHASVTTGNAKNVADGQYHTFAIERTADRVTQSVDGVVTGTITRAEVVAAGGDAHGVFDRAHVVRLNTGADSKNGWADNRSKAAEASEMRIDYVRYYR